MAHQDGSRHGRTRVMARPAELYVRAAWEILACLPASLLWDNVWSVTNIRPWLRFDKPRRHVTLTF